MATAMMRCPDSIVYVNVRNRALFCKGEVRLKSPQKALFGQYPASDWE